MKEARFQPTAKLTILGTIVIAAIIPAMFLKSYLAMWAAAIVTMLGLKLLTLINHNQQVKPQRQIQYLLGSVGLDAANYFENEKTDDRLNRERLKKSILFALLGAAMIAIGFTITNHHQLIGGWMEMIGLVQLLHFGLFQVLQDVSPDRNLPPLMCQPTHSKSVSEFWGKRWNTAFSDVTREYLFAPLARYFNPRLALLIGFIFSGLLHEIVITFPARGGYGLPTLYFVWQAIAVLIERSRWFKPLRSRIWTILAVALPAPILFPPIFVERVVVPMFNDLTHFFEVTL